MRRRPLWRSIHAVGPIPARARIGSVAGVIAVLAVLLTTEPLVGLAALAIIAAGVVARWPALGVYGAIACAPLHVYRHAVGPVNVSPFRVIIVFLGVAMFAHLALKTGRLVRPTPSVSMLTAAGFVVLYLGVAAVQSERSVTDLGSTLLGQRAIFLGSMLVLAAGILYLGLNRTTVVRVAVFSSLPPFLLALYQWMVGDPAQSLPFEGLIEAPGSFDIYRSGGFAEEGLRPAATFSDPNFLGIYAALTFILADADRATERGWLRAAGALLRVLSVLVILAAGSRTGVVVLLAYLLAIRLAGSGISQHVKLAVAGALVVCVLIFTLAPGPLDTLGRGDPVSSTREHVYTRASALGIGFAHPVTGIGIGNVGVLLGEPPDRSSAHALPFTVFAEEGALGLVLIVLVLGFPWLVMLRNVAAGGYLGLALGVLIAVWLYDFAFVLDVAAVWWGFALAAGSQGEGQLTAQRLRRVLTSSRNVAEKAKMTTA